jgi:putative membrane protein
MSSQDKEKDTLSPRVVMMERPTNAAPALASEPRVIATTDSGKIVPAPITEPRPPATVTGKQRRASLTVRLGVTGLVAAFCGWLGVDLYLWIDAAFGSSPMLGYAASAAAAVGIVGALAIVIHEMRTYLALKSVEANQQRFAGEWEALRPSEAQHVIRDVIAAIPKDRDGKAAIEAFQRQIQRHHTPAQQLDLLNRTVMTPLDRRAEAIVRRAATRAFGITAISPTAITDALFFIACSVRMVREIAACYGHRPSALATGYLLRRLIVEAGKLGAVDLAGATLTQHIGGAVAERLATSAAESIYASQRMARLGLVTMGLCRPIPYRPKELPGILSSLIGNLLAKTAETRADTKAAPDASP